MPNYNIVNTQQVNPMSQSADNANINNTNANIQKYNQLLNQNNQLNQQVSDLRQENNHLKTTISNNENDIFNLKKDLVIKNNEINKLRNEQYIFNLNTEINELKNKITNLENIKQYDNVHNTITVKFVSVDGKINYDIKCLNSDTFAEVEEKLYEKYDEYRLTDNIFLLNGNKILRFKKMSENNIDNGAIIQIQISSNLIGMV